MPKFCILCGIRPPTVPDRNSMGRSIKKICSECHAENMRDDLKDVLERHLEHRRNREKFKDYY